MRLREIFFVLYIKQLNKTAIKVHLKAISDIKVGFFSLFRDQLEMALTSLQMDQI